VRTFCLLAFVVGCGGASPQAVALSSAPAVATDPTVARESAQPPPGVPSSLAASSALPTACADPSAAVCTPPFAFVEPLCARLHQDATLALFAQGTPFSRMYLRGKMDELATDEEVLALRYHGVPKNGIRVGSAAGSYDVLRWDGTCSQAVDADMLTQSRPSRPSTARLQWNRLGEKTQIALIVASRAVKSAHARRGKECRGAMSGEVSAACEKADTALGEAIVEYLRGGGSLPAPEAL
jgi:hypothetical protein